MEKGPNGAAVIIAKSGESTEEESQKRSTPPSVEDGVPFDEINIESDLVATHTERREANGTSYFVERRTSEERALQMLENALESSSPPEEDTQSTQGPLSIDEIEPPIETVALVHRAEEDGAEKKVEEDTDSGILVVSQMSLIDPQFAQESSGKTDLEANSRALSSSHPSITHVAGTKTLPLKKKTNKNDRPQINTLHMGKPSKSDTDLRSMLFEEIKRFRRSDEEDDFTDPSLSSESIVGHSSHPVEALSPTIPEPPTFDQEKFDKAGTIPRPKIKITTMKRKAPTPPTTPVADYTPQPPTPEDSTDETLTKSSPNFTSFKSRLEAIYSRGPPNTFAKAPRPPKLATQNSKSGEESPNADKATPEEELQLAKVKLRPIDTVHRQKLIFNDVLKAINPDTRPSDIRNETHQNN